MSKDLPLILVTNDDGVSAKGIASLVDSVRDLGEVVVLAPDSPQSGMGHAITIHHPIRLNPSDLHGVTEEYSSSGTPVDCVKLAVYEIMQRKPDLLLSGINHGTNAATNVLYSGTMSAAVEGAMENIPSIGFSLDSFDADADFSVAKKVVRQLVEEALEKGIPDHTCLNVNIPYVKEADHNGIKVCHQAHAFWDDRFESRKDQFGRPYYWLSGDFKDVEQSDESDLYWLSKGYSTIVPTKFDMTAYAAMDHFNNWKL